MLFINPHRSDFVYDSPAYSIINRKSLKKYRYLNTFFSQNETEFYFITSSINRLLRFIKFSYLDSLFLKLEQSYFRRLNKLENNVFNFSNRDYYDVSFGFGFAIRDLNKSQFEHIVKISGTLIIHLSHYHLFADKLNYWSSFNNVVFCADADLSNNYFYQFYVNKTTPFFVLSYTIDNNKYKSYSNFDSRELGVISTGTFHEFEKMYSINSLRNNIISGIWGYLTIHPERRILYQYQNKLHYLHSFNSSMGKVSFLNLIKKNNSVNQTKYFSFDIVETFNKYKFSFIGEESVTGLPAIGVYESILCGCIPIINDYCYNGTPLQYSSVPLRYNNINHLVFLISNLKVQSNLYKFDEVDFNDLRNSVATFFSDDYQISLLNQFLKN